MRYDNLHALINASSSTRAYFLSLPVEIQMSLHQHSDYIHTAAALHRKASMIENYQRHSALNEGKI